MPEPPLRATQKNPFTFQVRQILFPRPPGRERGARGGVGVPLSPSTAVPCVLWGIARPLPQQPPARCCLPLFSKPRIAPGLWWGDAGGDASSF